MQNGPADQADLADFIARSNKPDLVELLRHAGERLPSGSDTAADHRVVLLHYLRRAPSTYMYTGKLPTVAGQCAYGDEWENAASRHGYGYVCRRG